MNRPCPPSPTGDHSFAPGSAICTYCLKGGVVIGGQVVYVPTDKGEEFHKSILPNLLFWGGRGSGKSMALRWEAHMRALAHPNFSYIILRRTFPELQKSHLIHIPREARLLGATFNYTDKIIRYPNGSRGFFSHCATEEDVLNLLSAEFAWAGFDELSTFEWDMFAKLSASVRVPYGSGLTAMVRAATNPLGPSAAKLLEYFVDKSVDVGDDPDYNPNDWGSIHANLIDNPHLDREQYKKRFSGLPAHVRKAWVDGEFVLENALFNLEPKRDNKPYHVVVDLDLGKIVRNATIYRTIDAGWFPDPTVILWIAHLGHRHIVIHEKTLYKHTAAQTAQIIKEEDKYLASLAGPNFNLRVAMTYCDPSMDINTTADVRTIKDIYEANGIPMECSINKRDAFAIVMHNALAGEAGENLPTLQFYKGVGDAGCHMLVKTIPYMRYDDKRPSFMADHRDDHWVVACCYYLLSHSADSKSEFVQQVNIRPWMREKPNTRFVLGADQIRQRITE
jgi:hypothetical protein